jgi:uncharacterized membrane protein YeaQ/YmgE (transglycosylase-associated protein family)
VGVLSWILFGLIVGILAKFFMPGQGPGGCIATVVIGIVGAAVGGFIGTQLGFGDINGFDLRSMFLAVIGGIVVLLIYGAISNRRA